MSEFGYERERLVELADEAAVLPEALRERLVGVVFLLGRDELVTLALMGQLYEFVGVGWAALEGLEGDGRPRFVEPSALRVRGRGAMAVPRSRRKRKRR